MSLVCKTLVLVENVETLKVVATAFPHPKYELEFVDNFEEVHAHTSSNRPDMFIVDSKFAGDERLTSIKHSFPTLVVEPEYVSNQVKEINEFDEASRIRSAAEKLLRKNYINWIIDALEYSS